MCNSLRTSKVNARSLTKGCNKSQHGRHYLPIWRFVTKHRLHTVLVGPVLYFPVFCALLLNAVDEVNFATKCSFLFRSPGTGWIQVMGDMTSAKKSYLT